MWLILANEFWAALFGARTFDCLYKIFQSPLSVGCGNWQYWRRQFVPLAWLSEWKSKEQKPLASLQWLCSMVGGLVAKSCPTLAITWTVACQAPLSMGFSRQEYWSGLPFPSPGDLPDPGIEPGSPTLQVDSLACLSKLSSILSFLGIIVSNTLLMPSKSWFVCGSNLQWQPHL